MLFYSNPRARINYADLMFEAAQNHTDDAPYWYNRSLVMPFRIRRHQPTIIFPEIAMIQQDLNQNSANIPSENKFIFNWGVKQPARLTGPRGIRNNNWGNIIKTSKHWLGEVDGSDSRFEQFETPEFGVSAMAENLRSYVTKHNKRTLADIIGRWAPPNENNTSSYIQNVSRMVAVDPHQDIADKVLSDDEFMIKLMKAIAISENGEKKLQTAGNVDQILRDGLTMANKNRAQK